MESNESQRRKRGRKTDLRFHSLPDDLVIEILYKLALELIVRLRSVSKHWNSLISDPCFAYNYCSRRPLPQLTCIRQKIFVEGSGYHDRDPPRYNILNNFRNFSYFSLLSFPEKLLDESKRKTKYMVIGSSNGLFLCASESKARLRNTLWRDYYICNPIPREWIKLPSPIMSFESRNAAQVGFTTRLQGFLVVTSYKVVIFHRIQTDLLKFEVFSSETNTWLVYTMNPPCPLEIVTYGSVSRWVKGCLYNCVETADGLLHWVDNTSYNVLISYDPDSDTNSCRLINLPKNQIQDKESERLYKRVDAFNGSLRYLEVFSLPGKPGFYIGIWTLEDYDGNWTLERTLTIQDGNGFEYRGQCKIMGPCHDSDSMYVWKHQNLHIYNKEEVASNNHTMKLRCILRPCYQREGKVRLDNRMDASWTDILPLSRPIWPTTLKTATDGHHPLTIRIPKYPLPIKIEFEMDAFWMDILPLSQPIQPTTLNTATDGHHPLTITILELD